RSRPGAGRRAWSRAPAESISAVDWARGRPEAAEAPPIVRPRWACRRGRRDRRRPAAADAVAPSARCAGGPRRVRGRALLPGDRRAGGEELPPGRRRERLTAPLPYARPSHGRTASLQRPIGRRSRPPPSTLWSRLAFCEPTGARNTAHFEKTESLRSIS